MRSTGMRVRLCVFERIGWAWSGEQQSPHPHPSLSLSVLLIWIYVFTYTTEATVRLNFYGIFDFSRNYNDINNSMANIRARISQWEMRMRGIERERER